MAETSVSSARGDSIQQINRRHPVRVHGAHARDHLLLAVCTGSDFDRRLLTYSIRPTPYLPKCLTPLTFLNMFDRSFYLKTFVICVKLYVYIKVYLTINQMIEKELTIT